MFLPRQCDVETQGAIFAGMGYIELTERDRPRGCSEIGTRIPTGPLAILLECWYDNRVIVGTVDNKVWLFADNRCICHDCERRTWPSIAWRIRIPNENHIPHRTIPITELCVASEILLLTPRNHVVIHNSVR